MSTQAQKVVQVTLQQGTFYEVRDERELPITKFPTQAQANYFAQTGVYPAGMMRSDRFWPL